MTENDYKDLELINVKLAKKDYEMLLKILERETAHNWFVNKIKSYWVWGISGSVMTIWLLYDKFIEVMK